MTYDETRLPQSALAMALLEDERPIVTSVKALVSAICDTHAVAPLAVRHAYGKLEHVGVVVRSGGRITASPRARRLETLDLIGA